MAKGMSKGHKGGENKPKLTLKEKLAKRKLKKQQKLGEDSLVRPAC